MSTNRCSYHLFHGFSNPYSGADKAKMPLQTPNRQASKPRLEKCPSDPPQLSATAQNLEMSDYCINTCQIVENDKGGTGGDKCTSYRNENKLSVDAQSSPWIKVYRASIVNRQAVTDRERGRNTDRSKIQANPSCPQQYTLCDFSDSVV